MPDPSPAPAPVEPAPTPGAAWARAAVPYLAAALVALTLVPCLVPLIPQVAFDLDPRAGLSVSGGATGLTAAGLAWWAAGLALVSASALAAALIAGARPQAGMLLLTAGGAAAIIWHLGDSIEDALHGAAWLAALAAAAAWLHLGRFAAARRWAAAVLLGVAPLWALDAGREVWVEHPHTLAFFAEHKAELLAARGLEPGSGAAELYTRRLSFNDATGAVGFSNVFASLGGAAGVLAVAAGATWLRRRRWAAAGAAALGAVGAGLVVALTHSKGAPGALLVTAAAAVAVAGVRRWGGRAAPALAAAAGPLAVLAVLAAIALRLAVGEPAPPPDGFVPGADVAGERSLLFRGHYAAAAARIAGAHPLAGSGVRGFADLYPQVKPPLNPESVTSAHGLVADAVAMLGLGGWAVVGLLGVALARAGRARLRCDGGEAPPADPASTASPGLRPAVLAGLLLFGIALPVQIAVLSPGAAWGWLLGIGLFAAVVAAVARPGAPEVPAAAWWAVAVFVAVHGQVEMTFFQPASVVLMATLVAVAAAVPGLERPPTRGAWRRGVVAAVAPLAVLALAVLLAVHAARVTAHDAAMTGAAAALRRGEPALAVERLAAAQDAAGLDRTALSWRVRLHALERPGGPAGRSLAEARGWLDAAERGVAVRGGWFARQRAALADAVAAGPAVIADARSTARDLWAAAAALQPHHVAVALGHADAAVRAGDPAESVAALYARVLTLRENGYLDAADPLTPAQLDRARARAGAAD